MINKSQLRFTLASLTCCAVALVVIVIYLRESSRHRAILEEVLSLMEVNGLNAFVPMLHDQHVTKLSGKESAAIMRPILRTVGTFSPHRPTPTASDGNSIMIEVPGPNPITVQVLFFGKIIVTIPNGKWAGNWSAKLSSGSRGVEVLRESLGLSWPKLSEE